MVDAAADGSEVVFGCNNEFLLSEQAVIRFRKGLERRKCVCFDSVLHTL